MAANSNPNLSSVALTDQSEEVAPSLPVVRVLPTQDGKSVVVKFDEFDSTTAPLDRVYTNEPYNFRAINAGGREPRFKTFGSLIACNGGTLIIGEDRYRIQADASTPCWYMVSGVLVRPTTHAGARYELFKMATPGGFYPSGLNAGAAFHTEASDEADHSIISFSVVFKTQERTGAFVDDLEAYLRRNDGHLHLVDDQGNAVKEPTISEIAPFQTTMQSLIFKGHYKPQQGEAAPGSPVIDVVVEERSNDFTVDVTILSMTDSTFRFQRFENNTLFAMADPESAHIFPSAKCVGVYEWLDIPDFNRLALSRDVHLNFDGTGRGRGKRRKTTQSFAIRPIRSAGAFSICKFEDCFCYRIPLELVLNRNEIADSLLSKLGKMASLNKHPTGRWTITGDDVRIFYPQNRRITLTREEADNGDSVLVTAIPGVDDLNECWSNTVDDLYSLESAEVLEKCLLWNYQNAIESWSLAG